MPSTRSQTQQFSESHIMTTADGTGATSCTYSSTGTIEANTAPTESTMDVSKPHNDEDSATHTATTVRISRPSGTSSRRRKELTKARIELLQREIELAALRVATLEVEYYESINNEATVKEERTSTCINESTITVKPEPHNENTTSTTIETRTCDVSVDVPEQCLHRDNKWHVREMRHTCTETPDVGRKIASHNIDSAQATRRCKQDGYYYTHYPLFRRNFTPSEPENTTLASAIVSSAKDNRYSCAFIKILPVELTGPKGSCRTYALLDDGSTCTLIEAAMAEKIGMTGPPAPLYIKGVAGNKINATGAKHVRVNIRGIDTPSYDISARTMEDLRLSPQTVSRKIVRSCKHLKDIEKQLAYYKGKPTVIIGQDNWPLLIPHTVRRGTNFQPVASLTNLGWVIHGTRDIGNKDKHYRTQLFIKENGKASNRDIEKMHRLPAGGLKSASYKNDRSRSQFGPPPMQASAVLGRATDVDVSAQDYIERVSTLSTHRVKNMKKRQRQTLSKFEREDTSQHSKLSDAYKTRVVKNPSKKGG